MNVLRTRMNWLTPVLCVAAASALLMAAGPAAANLEIYTVAFSGANESPATASPGTGTGTVTFDLGQQTMRVQASFSGLLAGVTAAHIHCCTTVAGTSTVGIATTTPSFPGFPTGVISATYDHTFDMTAANTYSAAFATTNGGTVAGAMQALLTGSRQGKAYFNIHTTSFAGGEIRGFLLRAKLLDVDADSRYDALTDGLLVLRYLFGLTGAPMTSGALSNTATRTDPVAIKSYLDGIRGLVDVDGNGNADALTDSLLIIRYLFGLRGSALIAGAVDPGATRKTPADIEAYIQSLMP